MPFSYVILIFILFLQGSTWSLRFITGKPSKLAVSNNANIWRYPVSGATTQLHKDFASSSKKDINIGRLYGIDTVNDAASNEEDKNPSTLTDRNKFNWPVIAISSANLIKNCVGAGVFSLNSRVSSISADLRTVIPASGLIMTMAAWAAYNFFMVGETCRLSDSTSYGEAWSKSVSPKTEWIIQFVTIVAPIISCLANVIVLTDILGFMLRYFGAPEILWSNRKAVIALLSSVVLFPISISKDLSGLKAVSVFGIMGHLAAVMTLGVRIKDKSYLPGGQFYDSVVGSLPTTSAYSPSKYFVLASLLSYCFVTHYNAPRYFKEMNEKNGNPRSFPLFAGISYGVAALIYIMTMVFGVTLFGPKSASFALNSFSVRDPLANIARLAFGASVLASFPLIFLSVRTFFINQLKKIIPSMGEAVRPVTFLLLSFIGLLAVVFTDIGVVGSLSGGLLGSSMMFLFPPIMYTGAILKKAKREGKEAPLGQIFFNGLLTVLGGSLGFFGTALTIRGLLKK